MAAKQFTMATLAGGVAVFVMGFLLYGLALADFFASNAGTATGVMKEAPLMWSLILGQVITAAFLVMVMGWRGDSSAVDGLKTGALVGLILGLGLDFTFFGVANTQNLIATLVDPFVFMIQLGVGGAVIGVVLGMGSAPAVDEPASTAEPAPTPPPPPAPAADEHTGERSAGM